MINGIVYENRRFPAAGMAHALRQLGLGGYVTKGCTLSVSGSSVIIAAGYFVPPYGHMVSMEGTTTVTPAAVSSTYYATLVYEIDLSQTNTVNDFEQGSFKVLTNTTDFPSLTQDDLEADPTGTYQMPWANFMLSSSGISSFTDLRVVLGTVNTITANVADWTASGNGFEVTMTCNNMTADRIPRHFAVHHTTNETDATRKSIDKNAAYISTVTGGNGTITLYATQKPAIALSFDVEG